MLEKVGLFDEDLKTDEIDICWRINLSGGRIVFAPRSVVYHARSGSFGTGLSKERVLFGDIAAFSCVLKNYELETMVKVFPYLLSYSIGSVANDVFVRHRLDMVATRLRGYLYVLQNLRRTFRKRSHVQKYVRSISDVELRKIMVRPNFSLYFVPDTAFLRLVRKPTHAGN